MTLTSGCVRSMFLGFVALGSVFASPVVSSAVSNPALFAERDGIDDASRKRPLQLASLVIDITIEGSIAETTLTAAFAGIRHESLEGHFSLALPEGAIVNGYALDIGETMVEGVLVARPKARAVYDSKVRRSIDPGIAEVSSSNVFATQVYPIQAESGRTIRVRFVTPVHRGLVLPLATDDPVGSVQIRLKARDVAAPPQIELPNGIAASWQRTRDGYSAAASADNATLTGALSVAPTMPRRAALLSMDHAGQRFFQIRDTRRSAEHAAFRPNRVRVYWDASLSRRDDRLSDEINLLVRYMQYAAAPVDLVLFNSTAARVSAIETPDRLRTALESVTYRGGTSFAVIDSLRLPDAELCLLFSDGAATIDRRDTFKPDCTLKSIASSRDADRGYLAQLTRDSGGDVIYLGSESADASYQRLVEDVPALIGATSVEGRPLSFAVIENDDKGWFVLGEAPRSDDVVLQFKARRGRTFEQRYTSPKLRSTRFAGVAAMWAADQVAALATTGTRQEEIERLARRYSVTSPTLAFVVLETPYDYANAEIVPPKNYPRDAWEEYSQAKAERDEQMIAERAEHFDALREAWQERKEWWEEEHDPRAKPQTFAAKASRSSRGDFGGGRGGFVGGGGGLGGGHSLEEIVVTAMLVRSYDQEVAMSIAPFQADRPYLRALEAADDNDLQRLLAAQEKDHGQLPAFYLDTAEWLYQRDQVAEASEMLLSALELPVSNDETASIVADRLLRYGYVDRAVWLHEQAAQISSHRPQPKMQLALALAKRASIRTQTAKRDLQRAIALLNEVATTVWDGAYEGIELTALMEANALIPRLRRLGGTRVALAPELIALLDLDVRVVIQWNTAATDLDLWIDEPNGERASFNNQHTTIGGLMSEDMTNGYGPEEYLLRKASSGEYRVHIDVYAADSINPNGATTVTARLIHDFGRPTEHEESIDIELLPDVEGEKFVGSIRVGGAE